MRGVVVGGSVARADEPDPDPDSRLVLIDVERGPLVGEACACGRAGGCVALTAVAAGLAPRPRITGRPAEGLPPLRIGDRVEFDTAVPPSTAWRCLATVLFTVLAALLAASGTASVLAATLPPAIGDLLVLTVAVGLLGLLAPRLERLDAMLLSETSVTATGRCPTVRLLRPDSANETTFPTSADADGTRPSAPSRLRHSHDED